MNAQAIARNGEFPVLQLLFALTVCILLMFGLASQVEAALPDVDPGGTYIEAENYTAMGSPNPWQWEVQSGVPGYSDTGYLYTLSGGTGTVPNGSRTDYPVNFTTAGQYCIWIRAMDASGNGGGDSTFWGVDGSHVGAITQSADNVWAWDSDVQNGSNCTTISAGNHTLNLWPREGGQKTDAFVIAMVDANADPSGGGLFTGDNDQTTVIPGGATVVDPTSAGGPASGYVLIPDGQIINGNPLNPEDLYQTDLDPTNRQYRVLGAESDGFNDFSVDSKWTRIDIGNDPPSLNPTIVSGTLDLTGRGQNIWGTRDYFTYLYQGGKSGDFTIDVKVNSQDNTAAFAKAGIMVRQSLTNNSRHAMVLLTPSNGAGFYRRLTDGASTLNTLSAGVVAPRWVRIKRVGNTFTGYYSSDGISWNTIGSDTIAMTGAVNVGLAVSSVNTGTDNTANFDNFLFMPAGVSGMSETWSSTSTALPGSIATTGWTDQDYAISVRSTGGAVEPETNSFTFSTCSDASPSTVSVIGGTVSGSSVSLPALFNYTGNVGTFSYQIDGVDVGSPWNSFSAYGPGTSGTVQLRVQGVDPDCGGSTISDTGSVTVDNTCSDATPSTLTILTGQTAGGTSVDLTSMVSQTGNLGTLTYKINGTTIGTPSSWDSTGYGLGAPESVTFEVSGTDPDCTTQVTAVNSIEIDNTCTRNPPSISFNQDVNYVGAGRAVPYQVTIRNEDSPNCGSSTFSVAITVDPVNSNFVASYFNPLGSNSNITLAGRESATIELAVEATSGATEWSEKGTTLEITSGYTGDGNVHNTPKTTGAVTTKVFLVSPITHNSVTTHSSKWDGKWGTSESGAKYGNFDCLLCHEKNGPNIKWMTGEIQLPTATWGTGATAEHLPITFKDAREGGDWGNDDPNDDGSGRVGSTRPCEVCHTITDYHRYDTNANPADPPEGPVGPQTITQGATHFPDRDCTDCHRHSLGFTASCIGCHGDPPLDTTIGGPNGLADIPDVTGSVTPGTHYKHVVVLNFPCEYCHAGWRTVGEMPKTEPNSGLQQINHTFAVFGSAEPAASAGQYTGQDGVNYQPVADLQTRGVQDANGTVNVGQGTLTCENIYCHGGTDNMGGTNPLWNGNISCNSCHGTSATNTPPGYSHTTHVGQMGLACTICHGTSTGLGANGHVSGSVHIDLTELRSGLSSPSAVYNGVGGTSAGAVWDSGKLAPSDADVSDGTDLYGTCSNVACHYGTTTPVWNNNNNPATCTICHNDGTDDGTLDHAAPVTGAHSRHMDPSSLMGTTFIDKCQSCHGGGANLGNHTGHVDFDVDFAGNLSWNSGNRNCTNSCHEGDYSVGLWDSLNDLNCDACHKTPYIGPTVVDPNNGGAGMAASGYGSHLKAASGDSFNVSTDWKAQCEKCHPYHSGGSVTVAEPPNNWTNPGTGATEDMAYKLGLQFPITGGIHLGGTVATGGTEAEICWNCHNANGISEWNGQAYNGYSVSSSNWRSASFNAPGSTIPTRAAAAIHTANMTSGSSSVANNVTGTGTINSTKTLEAVSAIRCSYCHDVHDTNMALLDDGVTNESATGAPYLRGTWLANPYPLERPPESGDTYSANRWTHSNHQETDLPRLFASSTGSAKVGGFFIDQNSSWPTAAYVNNGDRPSEVEATAGICVLCHGTDVDGMDYYTGSKLWRPGMTNGHSNSALGGTGSNAVSIFDARHGATGVQRMYMGAQDGLDVFEYGDGGDRPKDRWPARTAVRNGGKPGVGNTNPPPQNLGWWGTQYEGSNNLNTGATLTNYNNWFSASGIGHNGGTSGRAHDFSCSKCHTPHASGLPALLITNCLDKGVATWSVTKNTTLGPTATNTWAVRAQVNCHRKEGSRDSGWNYLAPNQ